MTAYPKFSNVDTRKPDGFYVQFAPVVEIDDSPWDGDCEAPAYLLSVYAEARCMVVSHGVGTLLNLHSAGLPGVGVNDMADPYLDEVFKEQKAELLATIAAMHDPIIES